MAGEKPQYTYDPRSRRLSLAFCNLTLIPSSIVVEFGLSIEELDLTYNNFSELHCLQSFPNVGTLVLDGNRISSHTKFPVLPNLRGLSLNQNQISNLAVFLENLVDGCPNLRFLSMMKNEAAPSYFNGGSFDQYQDYRYFVISRLPKLQVLDDKEVSKEERAEAERLYGITFNTNKEKKEKRRKSVLGPVSL